MTSELAIIPVSDVQLIANAIARSGLFGVKTPDQAFALCMLAQAEGMHPATAALDYDIIQGRPAKRAQAMQRDFIRAGGKVEWHKMEDGVVDATFSHQQGGTVRVHWDMRRAERAGLAGKATWKQYPRQMLRARVISEGVRTVYPMATGSLYTPEEVRDFEPRERDMGAAEVVNQETGEITGNGTAAPSAPAALPKAALEAAKAGMASLNAWWTSISKETRIEIGAEGLAKLKDTARQADADLAEAFGNEEVTQS